MLSELAYTVSVVVLMLSVCSVVCTCLCAAANAVETVGVQCRCSRPFSTSPFGYTATLCVLTYKGPRQLCAVAEEVEATAAMVESLEGEKEERAREQEERERELEEARERLDNEKEEKRRAMDASDAVRCCAMLEALSPRDSPSLSCAIAFAAPRC